jgi:lactoylglutathione lyase
MTETTYAFTKLVVRDLDAMTRYYGEVYGLAPIQRVQAKIDGAPIDQITLGRDGAYGGLILLRWTDQDAPPSGDVILGFLAGDVDALFARAEAAGGRVRVAPKPVEEAGGRVVGFLEDPEGHLAEVVEQG